ncbi:MAG: hypothetical protein EXQ90_02365 [Rhodospirillales bacterium]|nr:hypothetical protein [Rhodospirillales bacterium]
MNRIAHHCRRLLVAAAIAMMPMVGNAADDLLSEVKACGTIRVALQAKFEPAMFRDSTGKIVGFNPDVAE